MYIFDIDAVRRALDAMDSNWKEFMRVETLSAGVYRLKAGERDGQKPHAEDEIYVVTQGQASRSLLCRLATSVPPPHFHTVRNAGVLASREPVETAHRAAFSHGGVGPGTRRA